MEQFASGWKRSYYGKGDVIVYRLNRGAEGTTTQNPVFGASVLMLVYGDAFWPTYTKGDNTGLIATDSMKNFIQLETANYTGNDLEDYCWFLGATSSKPIHRWRGSRFLQLLQHRRGAEEGHPEARTWKDLTKPVYKGQIVMPNPASSGTGFFDVTAWLQLWGEGGKGGGWKYMDALHENIAQYTHSGSKPCNMAAAGEYGGRHLVRVPRPHQQGQGRADRHRCSRRRAWAGTSRRSRSSRARRSSRRRRSWWTGRSSKDAMRPLQQGLRRDRPMPGDRRSRCEHCPPTARAG